MTDADDGLRYRVETDHPDATDDELARCYEPPPSLRPAARGRGRAADGLRRADRVAGC
jgi:hypothetical protein